MDDLNLKDSPLYSQELAPVPKEKRTWSKWHLAALWVGMAVCIPTWVLASYMLKAGLNWIEALIIIGLGNLVITLPMVLNGFPGVRYGLSFPVIGRAAFGVHGVHLASLLRGLVACGWFGVQTWIGGLAVSAIWHALTGTPYTSGLNPSNFIGFGVFWAISMFFVFKGFEGIKWLEEYAAPVLLAIGIALIVWGSSAGGGFSVVLQQSEQLKTSSMSRSVEEGTSMLHLNPLRHPDGTFKASHLQWQFVQGQDSSQVFERPLEELESKTPLASLAPKQGAIYDLEKSDLLARFLATDAEGTAIQQSSWVLLSPPSLSPKGSKWLDYLLWFTAMVGFWATMAISISDITRFAKSQKDQVAGQFMGLPATMMLFSFVGLFVTSAAIVAFDDILIQEDAPWDPASLLAHFDQPMVIVGTQIILMIATLSTNLAANLIAPATAFSNMFPKKVSFKMGGLITGILGIVICPWWLLDEISAILVLVSAFLGPVLGVLLADFFWVRKGQLSVKDLFLLKGKYSYTHGLNLKAFFAVALGILLALLGLWIPSLEILYKLAWFTGFFVAFFSYALLMKPTTSKP